jgi:hypothetical protein
MSDFSLFLKEISEEGWEKLISKHIRNLWDESVVKQWSENLYFQYFTGESSFVPAFPGEAYELVHFRRSRVDFAREYARQR